MKHRTRLSSCSDLPSSFLPSDGDPAVLHQSGPSSVLDSRGVDSMKHIVKILTLLVAIAALWIGLLQISVVPDSHTWLLPIYFVVSLGCYGLLMVGVGLMQFRTCPEEFVLLQEDISEAKVFLKQKGVDVGSD